MQYYCSWTKESFVFCKDNEKEVYLLKSLTVFELCQAYIKDAKSHSSLFRILPVKFCLNCQRGLLPYALSLKIGGRWNHSIWLARFQDEMFYHITHLSNTLEVGEKHLSFCLALQCQKPFRLVKRLQTRVTDLVAKQCAMVA